MYTRQQFGKELKDKIRNKIPTEKIGYWSYLVYLEYSGEIDSQFDQFLIDLGTMELGPEFAYSYEKLEKIADELMLGNIVELR